MSKTRGNIVIQAQLKLKLNRTQELKLEDWLQILTRVWNWAIRKIELDKKDGNEYYSKFKFQNLLAGHSKRLDIPAHTLSGILVTAWSAWDRCFKKLSKRPRMKGRRNRLVSLPFPDPIPTPVGNSIKLPMLGGVKFHMQNIPVGRIKCGRVLKKSSGWFLALFIDAAPSKVALTGDEVVGIDPGLKTHLTLSSGEKVHKISCTELLQKRLAQAQKGGNKKLISRIHERIRNTRKNANHQLAKKLVSCNREIYFSKDSIQKIASSFGKSTSNASIYQLRQMLAYKAQTNGRVYKEIDGAFSTQTCSVCWALTGPTGKKSLHIREWECDQCHTVHDRDLNSAIVTRLIGTGEKTPHKPSGTDKK